MIQYVLKKNVNEKMPSSWKPATRQEASRASASVMREVLTRNLRNLRDMLTKRAWIKLHALFYFYI